MIICTRFKTMTKGSLIGFADIFVPKWGIEIKGITLYMKDGKRWINLPSKEYKNENGETKYAPIIQFRDDNDPSRAKVLFEEFSKRVREAIETHCGNMPHEESLFNNDEVPF